MQAGEVQTVEVVFHAVYQRLEAAASSPVLHHNECSLLDIRAQM